MKHEKKGCRGRGKAQSKEHEVGSKKHTPCNRLAEAHNMSSQVYHWFMEGFDTKDLQEAKALLEDLGEMAKRVKGKGKIRRPLFSITQ